MTEPPKAAPSTQETPYPPPAIVTYPHQAYNGAPYPPPGPPGAYMPPFYAYPHPPDGAHPEGGPNGGPPGPYMIGLPPGVVYAYPPHPQAPPAATPASPPALSRPKRKQVKMACTNCAGACKRCDETRPCERCVKYGVADSCVDGQRKERKKGIKRGPYKRKAKGESDSASFNGDWPAGSQPPTTPVSVPPIHVAQYAPEGYYPIFYPPPGFMPHPHESQPGPDGSPSHAMPYYIHPGSYPPFPHYPPMYPQGGPMPPGAPPANPVQQPTAPGGPSEPPPPPPQTVNPSDTAQKAEEGAAGRNGAETNGTTNGTKKRPRTTKNGEPKPKKVKTVNGGDVPPVTAHTDKGKEKENTPQANLSDHAEQQVNGDSSDSSGDLDKSA